MTRATLYKALVVALFGLVTSVLLWFFFKRKKKDAATEADQPARPGAEEIDSAIRDAETRLAAAKLTVGSRVGGLPVFLLVGDSGVSKTSTMLHSGVEPELLAGQVYENSDVIPTRTVNIWFSRRVLFVEAGGQLPADSEKWTRLVGKLAPRGSVVGKGETPPRAAIVFYDCQNFLHPDAQVAAREAALILRARLAGISQAMGISLPVYVLFSKMDCLPFFKEYAANFSQEEARQVFGVTLPILANRSEGVYAEAETARLTSQFDELFRSLAESRPKFLASENESARLLAIYEFPREFRKIRPAAVQFLLEVCRPSQLTLGPFLRGFYFTGVRPVIITEDAPVRPVAASPDAEEVSGATQILERRVPAALQSSTPILPSTHARKVPQWVFLGRLFQDVILADRTAHGASGASIRTSLKRRAVLAAAAIVCLLLNAAFTVSFARNRVLASGVRLAVDAVSPGESINRDLASLDALRSLDQLRRSLEKLGIFQEEGPPWSYRWGLYAGDELYPIARRLYFARFQVLLLDPARKAILENLHGLPTAPGPEYGPTYDALKAYLITTSNHDKSTRTFLVPMLLKWWSSNTRMDPPGQALARKQFDFYSENLKEENPFSSDNDSAVIEKSRRYLAQFAGAERVYAFMVADAAKHGSAINFNRQFPGSASVVLDTHEVLAAFSQAGWQFMKEALQHTDRYVSGERWVLGDQDAALAGSSGLQKDLQTRYYADFAREWRSYIKSASLVPYTDIKDAVAKLGLISGNQSPLLALLALASQNTAVDDPAVASVFQPVQTITPPESKDRYIAPPNQNYINALVTLQASLENATGQADDPSVAQALNNALQAKIVTRQMAQSFRLDNDGHIEAAVQKLLEDPILNVEQTLHGAVPAGLNAAGKGLCTQWRMLTGKFPFNPNSRIDAALADVNAILHKPDGALWTFYDKSLKKVLVKQGSQYVPSGVAPLNPAFVSFFNLAAALSDTLYPAGAADPALSFAVKPGVSEGVQGITLHVDGQTLAYTVGSPIVAKTLTWQANGTHDMTVNVRVGGSDFEWQHHTGLWGAFHFFAEAKQHGPQGLEWPVGAGAQQFKVDGKPVTVRLEVDLGPVAAAFQNGFPCVADVTH
jgi:type VI secretion system protein ImpL